MPPGTELALWVVGHSHVNWLLRMVIFGFQTLVPLGTVNMNFPSGTDDELSDMKSIPLGPNLGSPRHEQPVSCDAGDNIATPPSCTILINCSAVFQVLMNNHLTKINILLKLHYKEQLGLNKRQPFKMIVSSFVCVP